MKKNEYRINKDTLAIIPINKTKTKIYEKKDILVVNKNTQKLIEENCAFYGSSFNGRKKGTIDLIGVTHKPPIIIEETNELVFFPTTSPRLKECSWISLDNVDKCIPYHNESIIKFLNNLKIRVEISPKIINNQILRATRLESVHERRKKKMKIDKF